jgi:general secretion pathway protein D
MTSRTSTFVSLLALGAALGAEDARGQAFAPPQAQAAAPRRHLAKPSTPQVQNAPPPPVPQPATPPPAPAPATAAPPGAMSLTEVQQHPELTKPPKGLVDFTIEEGDLSELITTISTITGKRFIYGGKVRNIKVNIYAPKNQKITVDEAYQTFLSVLETNGLTVIPHGKFLKIVESAGVANQTTPLFNTGQPVPSEDRFVTRLYRVSHISVDEMNTLLTKFKSKDGDITVYAPGNLLILTDTAANIRRMLELIEEVDVGGAGDQVWVEPMHYMTATEISQRINEIFDVKPAAAAPGRPAGSALSDTHIGKIIPDDRSNSLIIVATERGYLRVLELIRRLDVPNTGEGEVHVMPLQHAMAEEMATTLNSILATAPQAPRPGQPATTGIFEGSVKVTADKATNSLVITSSLRDYGAMRSVIDRLDRARRQVFIEAVIMDLSVDHSTQLGLNYHGGDNPNLFGAAQSSLLFGGFNPINSIGIPTADSLQGLALGIRGPAISGTENLLGTGISIPAFGVVLNALATSGDANVLATPHIIATDNVAAEINVGENIPLQTNVGGSLPNLGSLATGAGANALGALGALGGFGAGFSAPRQDVGTKIKVIPHINDSDEVRLELTEEISERGASSGALGAVSITKRNAQTTVVVGDQQTVVIGGLMRDAVTRSETKVPVLGDIPVLGFLFRSTTKGTRKTNLLLILTPYVIRDQNDLRTVFERKMQERQEFLDRYFVFSDQAPYEPPRDYLRTNGLLEDIRQTYLSLSERERLQEETRPQGVKLHEAQEPLELPIMPSSPNPPNPPNPSTPTNPTTPTPRQAAPPAPGAGGQPTPPAGSPIAPVPVPVPVPGGTAPAPPPVQGTPVLPLPGVSPQPVVPTPVTPAPAPPTPPGAAPVPPPATPVPTPQSASAVPGRRKLGVVPDATLVPPLGSLRSLPAFGSSAPSAPAFLSQTQEIGTLKHDD